MTEPQRSTMIKIYSDIYRLNPSMIFDVFETACEDAYLVSVETAIAGKFNRIIEVRASQLAIGFAVSLSDLFLLLQSLESSIAPSPTN